MVVVAAVGLVMVAEAVETLVVGLAEGLVVVGLVGIGRREARECGWTREHTPRAKAHIFAGV